ncbi:MAG: twin-arginine translocase subunit TatC [Rikenellaceae bacterium]
MKSGAKGTFWEHLDDLRSVIVRVVVGVLVFAVAAFFFKDFLFGLILAPSDGDFITYRILGDVAQFFSDTSSGEAVGDFSVKLISTQLMGQFSAHIKMAFYTGFLIIFPYILFELFRFVSPALYRKERMYTARILSSSYIMFMIGVAFSYFVVFPLTFRFLGTYQVSSVVENQIVLDSYIGTLLMMNLIMGLVFEIPILSLLFAKLGLLSAAYMTKFRRHAIVILLVISMVITPTADIVTLLMVATPMYLLYELSIVLVKVFVRRKAPKSLEVPR